MVVQQPKAILEKYWGYKQFRPQQEDIIASVLQGKDTLALLPTGGGKSLCFQIPALIFDGLTLVVTPLIALMNDQVEQLRQRGIKAACIHSNMHFKEMERILDTAEFGNLRLLYVSPERLQSSDFMVRLKQFRISLLAVDEAHCISMWGYDFRPSYLQIASVRTFLKEVPVIALTATATSEVLADIQDKMMLRNTQLFRQKFLRSNLKFGVLEVEDKKERVIRLLKPLTGSAIVYVRNRRQTQELATLLVRNGMKAVHYHAGLEVDVRNQREQAFLTGRQNVIVATNAFGMGIDKADVRMVIHYDLPENLEAYYQEAGRAGRDGKDSYAILLHQDRDDKRLWRQFECAFPSMSEIRRVYHALGNYLKLAVGSGAGVTFDFEVSSFCAAFGFEVFKTWSTIKILEQAGWLVITERLYTPGSLGFLVDREVLYEYQLRNPQRERLIRALLRLYQGVLQDTVPVRERQLATFLKDNNDDLLEQLAALKRDGIIEYFPQSDAGRLTMLEPRTKAENLTIDQSLLAFRKERRKQGILSILRYIGLSDCRQAYLVRYFGDAIKGTCGICDNCRKKQKMASHPAPKLTNLRNQMLRKLEAVDMTIATLQEYLPGYSRKQILQELQFLLDEELVQKKDHVISISKR